MLGRKWVHFSIVGNIRECVAYDDDISIFHLITLKNVNCDIYFQWSRLQVYSIVFQLELEIPSYLSQWNLEDQNRPPHISSPPAVFVYSLV